MKYIMVFILGFVIGTVGISNFNNFLEKIFISAQETVKENVK